MFLLTLTLLLPHVLGGQLSGTFLDTDPKPVRVLSTYTMSFETPSAVSADYVVNFFFPTGITLAPNTAYPCSVIVDLDPVSSYHCEATASELKVFGAFGDKASLTDLHVKVIIQVHNPATSTQTDPIGISVTNSSGGLIDSNLSSPSMRVTATPG